MTDTTELKTLVVPLLPETLDALDRLAVRTGAADDDNVNQAVQLIDAITAVSPGGVRGIDLIGHDLPAMRVFAAHKGTWRAALTFATGIAVMLAALAFFAGMVVGR